MGRGAGVIVHLLEFRVLPGHEAEVAAYLRRFPHEDKPAGLLPAACAGHRVGRQHSEFVLASVWQDAGALGSAIGPGGLPSGLSPNLLASPSPVSFEIQAAYWGAGFRGARILRVFRGTIKAASLDLWRRRMDERVPALSKRPGLQAFLVGAVTDGPGAKTVAQDGRVAFIALSAWHDWDSVLAASGGHVDRPVVESNPADPEDLVGVSHYPLLDLDPAPGADPQKLAGAK